jgi:hypothetical protein
MQGTLIKVIETAEGITKVYDNGFLESVVHEGVLIDTPFLEEGKKQLEELGRGRKFYVLSEGAGHFRITRKARSLSASREYSSHLAAIAILTSHLSIKLMVDLYNKLDKPPVTTKSFTKREDAINWLKQQKAADEIKQH